jgi:hypothetical protein
VDGWVGAKPSLRDWLAQSEKSKEKYKSEKLNINLHNWREEISSRD